MERKAARHHSARWRRPSARPAPRARARALIIYGRPVRHVTGARASGRARHPAPPPAWHVPPLARSSSARTTEDGSRLCQPQPGRAEPSRSSHHAPTRKMDGSCFEGPPQAKANVNTGLMLWKFVIKPIHHPAAQIFSFLLWLPLHFTHGNLIGTVNWLHLFLFSHVKEWSLNANRCKHVRCI